MSFLHEDFELVDWLDENESKTKHNFGFSGLESPRLERDFFTLRFKYTLFEKYKRGKRRVKLEDTLSEILDIPRQQILGTSGSTLSLFLCFGSLIGKGDEVVVTVPNYPPMFKVPRILGAKTNLLRLRYEDGFQLDIGTLEDSISEKTKMIALTNSNNPTGMKLGKKKLHEIVELAERKGTYLLVDEAFREFSYDPDPIAHTFGNNNVISVQTMSKYFGMGDIKVGWIFASKQLIEKMKSLHNWVSINVGPLSEYIAIQILRSKRKFDARAKKFMRDNVQAARIFFNNGQQHSLEWVEPDGAPICFPRLTLPLSSPKFCEVLIKRFGILLSPGEFFEGPGHVRMCLTRKPSDTIRSLKALQNALAVISNQLPNF
jgi:aspartate/methionine/tyrosine aminotransferase